MGLKHGWGSHYYELDEPLQSVLETLAIQEQRPTQDIQAELIKAGLAQLHMRGELWQHWQSLSPREQQVAAQICLGYTNRQISISLNISIETVKTHVRNILVKFNLHGKAEIRKVLDEWDFSEWEKGNPHR